MQEKIIKLNNIVDMLIDVAHDTYMACTDKIEKVRLDGQIRAYYTMKNHIEDALAEENR